MHLNSFNADPELTDDDDDMTSLTFAGARRIAALTSGSRTT